MEPESHRHGDQRQEASKSSTGSLKQRMAPGSYQQNRPGARLLQQSSSGRLRQQEKDGMSTGVKNRSQTEMTSILQSGGSKGAGDRLRPSYPSQHQEESPDHSHHNSWAIDEEEDPELRAEFPDAQGHLFSVTLNKGSRGLGLNILSETNSKAVQGIVIMGIQAGGVADQCGRICWGDVILKMNHVNVVGMSQEQFQKLLAQATPIVTFVLLRLHAEEANSTQQQVTSSL